MYDYSALKQYQAVDVHSKVSASNAHGLVAMLLDGVLQKIAKASGAVQRGKLSEQGMAISSAIQIVDNLRASLDHSKGGELADNLRAIYDYTERRLIEANLKSDVEILIEANSLITQIKMGWDAIPDEIRGA